MSQIYFGMKLYMFQTVPASIVRSFSLYIQQWYTSYRFADGCEQDQDGTSWSCLQLSANLYDVYHCCMCSEKLMRDRGTVRNM